MTPTKSPTARNRSTASRPPTAAQKAFHNGLTMTAVHARRLLAGQTESKPTDYRGLNGEDGSEGARAQRSRRAIEDREMLRSLGLDLDLNIG